MAIDTRKILHTAFDKHTKNVDNYNHNGSTWLIFTDEKKWVIELTKEGTLWYNYYFFQNIMKLLSLEVVENQNYITEWVENFIQNGVKDTYDTEFMPKVMVDDTIQNGVKHTEYGDWLDGDERLDDIIENGVKETNMEEHHRLREVVRTLKDGVKETNWRCVDNHPTFVDSLIESGVNETWGYERQPQNRINEVIENGTKENPS